VRGHAGTILLVVGAVVCAIAPVPPQLVERVYSQRMYPSVQQVLTRATNVVPIALLDIGVAVLSIALIVVLVRRTHRVGFRRAGGHTLVTVVRLCAVLYLAFLVLWGLNYRRVPLEEKLDYQPGRITRDAVLQLANRAVAALNSGYAEAHAARVDLRELSYHFWDAESKLKTGTPTVLGVPKRSLLTFYFRRAAIDGMTDPVFLEIIVNPDVLDIERPMVVAHEWGHLAGYANEAEANFIAWLTCMRGDAILRYSGWFSAYEHAVRALSRQDRSAVTPLDAGPREDLRAMAARYARSSPVVRKAAQDVYDEYLRANRVAEGIASYDAVVRLMVGTRFDAEWIPVRR
jgi:hypothetical protein